jgi:hypothetical protein
LKDECKERAIWCDPDCGPDFNDINIVDSCDSGVHNETGDFGRIYLNDTQISGKKFFTGAKRFTVAEIEVFEVID